ncbi:MAG: molybdopterin-dependent oxidoreductase [Gemmatimonadaceae bacterium]
MSLHLLSPSMPLSKLRYTLALLTGSVLALCHPLGAQATNAARLEIRRDSTPAFVLTAAQLAQVAHIDVRASEHGKEATFSGIPLPTLLRMAGVPVDSVRGARTSWYVVATASDGYRVVFSLAELAPDLGGRAVFVADKRDGQALGASEGPLRLVVPDDKRPTRWERQVVTIAVRRGEP